jgi:hypothetical protein
MKNPASAGHASRNRWAGTLVRGFLGIPIVGYFAVFGAERTLSLWSNYVPDGSWLLIVFLLVILWWGNSLLRVRIKHILNSLRYPSIPVALLISFLVAPALPAIHVSSLELDAPTISLMAEAAALLSAIWIAQMAINHFRMDGPIAFPKRIGARPKETLANKDRLLKWVERETPIEDAADDLFGHASIAKRLIERLGREENTIALQGEYGSGKSSVIALAKHLAQEQKLPLIFANVSCWGFEKASDAQEAILSALIRSVEVEVDCFSLRGLPSDYVTAVGENVSWLRLLPTFLKKKETPIDQLRKLSPLLRAIESKAVVVVEDVDRNGAGFDVGQIQALLVQFREVEGLSFILAISSAQSVDFARLCDFVEIVPALEKVAVLTIIDRFRNLVLDKHMPAVLLGKLEPLAVDEKSLSILFWSLGWHFPWQLSLYELLKYPRQLKHCLRRLNDAWPRLSGEVRIDDLISVAALRTSAPEAFSFFIAKRDYFQFSSQKEDKNFDYTKGTGTKAKLQQDWKTLCETGAFDSTSAAWLLKDLNPDTVGVTGATGVHTVRAQSMQSKLRWRVYANRLLTEDIDHRHVTDQEMLMLLQGAKTNSTYLARMAAHIVDSEYATDAFRDLRPHTRFDQILPLMSEIYAIMRLRNTTPEKVDRYPAFTVVDEATLYNHPDGFEEWLNVELRKCIPGHLKLMVEIYHQWLGDQHQSFDTRKSARTTIFNELRRQWPTLSSRLIAAGFDPLFPYTLFHIVFTPGYEKPDQVPFGKAEDWSWAGPILLETAKNEPATILPQIINLVNADRRGDPAQPRFSFDIKLLQSWFPGDENAIPRLIAEGFRIDPQMPAEIKYLLKLAQQTAKDFLQEPEKIQANENG